MSSTASNIAVFPLGPEDPLALLPRAPVRKYKKNEVVYDPEDCNEALYLVVQGLVRVSRFAEGGKEMVVDFCSKDEFFGETGFLGTNHRGEQAVALEETSLMLWTIAELGRLMTRTPALAPALLRVLAEKLVEAKNRLEGLCFDTVSRRLAKAFLRLSQRLGQPAEDQMLHLPPITHEQLARYVGTSREIITQFMNQFRRDRLVSYSRRGIALDVAALQGYLYGAALPSTRDRCPQPPAGRTATPAALG